MSEGEHRDGEGERPDLRLFRGGRARGERVQPTSPREVARRLSALERRVEKALASSSVHVDAAGREHLRAIADEALGVLARARRLTPEDLRTLAQGLEDGLARTVRDALYRYWWRVEAVGLEHVPAAGPVIVVANRGGALVPYESLMIETALADRHPARLPARPLVEDWLAQMPLLGPALLRGGAIRGNASVRRLLGRGEAVILSPEAIPAKPFRDRYRLARFGRAAFARLAIESGAAIVPVAVIGAEEVHPVLARLDLPGRLLGLPTLPVTPTFPWLGLAGLVPLPTKWILLAGEPLDVAARHPPSDARDPAAVGRLRDQVRERLQALILEGLRRRRSLFRS